MSGVETLAQEVQWVVPACANVRACLVGADCWAGSLQGVGSTLEHEAKGFPWHAASVGPNTGCSESRSRSRHQVGSAGNITTTADDGAAWRLDEAPHCQVRPHLVP